MIILKNIQLIDSHNFEIQKGHLLIDSEKDGAYRFINDPKKYPLAEIMECEGLMAMKAFSNGHHHAYSTLARGMPFRFSPPKNFVEILEKVWWNLDKSLSAEMNEISAYYTAISSAKNGVASIIDHHASPFAIKDTLGAMYAAIAETGIDSLLCYEISERDGGSIREQGLEETDRFLSSHQGLVGLHASFTLEERSLKKAADLAQKHHTGIHIHMAESIIDQEQCEQKYGQRVVQRLNKYGFLDMKKSILAHGIHLSEDERVLIKEGNAWLVQNPESNLNNQVGYFNGSGLGDKIMLGTDGMHSNMIRSSQNAFFAGKNFEDIDMVKAYQRLRNTDQYLEENFSFSKNGLMIIKYDSPTPIHQDNFLGHFFFGFENRQIQHLIHHGKWVMKDQKILLVDEEIIQKEAQKLALQLWEKL